MKTIRILSLIALLAASIATVDLIYNVIYNLIPSINDGLGAHTLFLPLQVYFGDSNWTIERFAQGAKIAGYVFTALLAENVILSVISIVKGKK